MMRLLKAPPSRSRKLGGGGFTMIEMLVAIAVLALLVVLIAQIIGMTTSSVSSSSRKLDSVTETRFALDRLGVDWAGRLDRSDVEHRFTKVDGGSGQAGNDELSFYSEVDGYQGLRKVSVVGYRIQELDPERTFQMERGVQGTDWSATAPVLFGSQPLPVISDTDYEVLSEGVLRLEFCYLKTDGTLSNTVKSDLSDASALVVAVAVLDGTSRKIVSTAQLKQLAASLPDVVEGEDPIRRWHQVITDSQIPSSIPGKAVQALRFYQRYYEIYH